MESVQLEQIQKQVNLLLNLFEVDRFQIPSQNAVDFIERAIGVYQSDRMAAIRRTINPFWWLFRGLLWFARIPFVVLGAVGFDAARMERSVLGKYQISAKHAVAFIERAIGVYQSDRMAAIRRTINPFWWLFRGLLWFARIPFVVLGAVGFDAARMERSVLGKFFKAIIALVGLAAALLTIFNEPGWWTAAKALLGIE